MLVYPQLTSGALAQYPVEKRRRARSTAARSAGGTWYTRHDAGGDAVEWLLRYEDLTSEEVRRLREFFEETEGRLRTFTFADPVANLLRWSASLTHTVWEKGLTAVTASAEADPEGGREAFILANPSGAVHGVAQTVAGPGEYRYVLSAWLRGAAGTRIWLKLAGSAGEFAMDGTWRRHQLTAAAGSGTGVRFAIELEPGAACEVYGPQAEAQRAASGYQRSGGGSAVYSAARFDMDELRWVVEGPEQFGTQVRIRSRG